MYVCICKAITEKQVKQAIKAGHCSLHELRDELGLGSQCGRCYYHAKHLVQGKQSLLEMPVKADFLPAPA